MTLFAERAGDQTDPFADAFVPENFAHGCDVVKTSGNLRSTPFCLEKFCVRKGIF